MIKHWKAGISDAMFMLGVIVSNVEDLINITCCSHVLWNQFQFAHSIFINHFHIIMYYFPKPACFLIWLLCLPLGQSNLLVANTTGSVTANNSGFRIGSESTISGLRLFSNGTTTTLPNPPYASTVANTAGSVTVNNPGFSAGSQSPTSGRLFSNGSTTTVPDLSYSGTTGGGLASGHSLPLTSTETTLYTIDEVTFTGISNGLAAAGTTLTPGGSPVELI